MLFYQCYFYGWGEKMNINLIFVVSVFISLVIFLILYFVKKELIKVKYAIIWLLLFGLLLIFLIVPKVLNFLTTLLGFEVSSNMIFSLILAVLVIINISLTGIVSSQDKKIRGLIQEISIMKNNIK